MVERAKLTSRVVAEAACPLKGERWISDTQLKGFGLRLWSTKSGGQKAFAIRATDCNRKVIRRTFRPKRSRQLAYDQLDGERGPERFLDEARDWAKDEIDRIKGRLTRYQKSWIEHKNTAAHVRTMTLATAAASLHRGLFAAGRSQKYLDRLDKLFAIHVPEKLKHTELAKLNPKAVARALVKAKTSAGNIRVLRSFISQILERDASFDGRLRRFRDQHSREFSVQWERRRKVQFPELNRTPDLTYSRIFQALEADEEYWQQAMSIRLYFAFKCPLKRILGARWQQIHEDHWYPYWPREKVLWLECREQINDDIKLFLNRLCQLIQRDFGKSIFLFPSHYGPNANHITTVENAWRRALRRSRLPYYPLREFSRSFREFNNPSYYIGFLRQYGTHFREINNAANLSKVLQQRENSVIFQSITL